MNNNIGLIIWGCKGGHRVFCSNSIVDYRQKIISDTIKDIRSFVRFNLINLTTYALEFTDDYKVFTIYRSCNDNGTGAYVAITIYVPHKKKVDNLRTMLDDMMNAYFKEFVHPVFGTYYDGKYDDIELFIPYLDKMKVEDDSPYQYAPSVQDDSPHLKLYDNISEVESYWEHPYRAEFFDCQEVMFMSFDIFNKSPETLRFNSSPHEIKNVSPPKSLPQLYLGGDKRVKALKINGVESATNQSYIINASTTNVVITLQQKYCYDYNIQGTIANLIREGKLRESNSVISMGNRLPVPTYRDYLITFTVNGATPIDGLLYVKEKLSDTKYQHVSKPGIKVNGKDVNKEYIIALNIVPSRVKTQLLEAGSFKPSQAIENNCFENVDVNKFHFIVEFQQKLPENKCYAYLTKGKNSIEFDVPKSSGSEVTFFLPNGTKDIDVDFDSIDGKTDIDWNPDNRILRLTPKVMEYELNIPNEIQILISKWDFYIGEKSKKPFFGGRSFKIKLEKGDDISKGKLMINGQLYDFVEGPGAYITPKMIYIKVIGKPNDLFQYIPFGENKKIKTSVDEIFSYRKSPETDIIIDESRYEKIVDRNNTIVSIVLKKKDVCENPVENSENERMIVSTGVEKKDLPKDTKFMLIFENCEGFYVVSRKNGTDINLPKGSESIPMSADALYTDVYDCNEKKSVIRIFRDKKEYTDDLQKDFESKGFTLSYGEDKCHIKYEKNKSKNVCNLLKKIVHPLAIIPIVLVALSVVGGWWLWPDSYKTIATVRFTLSNSEFNEKISYIDVERSDLIRVREEVKDADTIFVLDIMSKRDTVEDLPALKEITKNIKVHFQGTNGVIIASLFEVGKTKPDIEEFFSKQKFSSKRTVDRMVEIMISTPCQHALDALQKDLLGIANDGEKKWDVYKKYARQVQYSSEALDSIFSIARASLNNENDYKLFLKCFEPYKDKSAYRDVKIGLEKIKAAKEEALKKDQYDNAMKQAARNYMKKLKDLTCTSNTVTDVERWYNQLKEDDKNIVLTVYNFNLAIGKYKAFFEAKNMQDVQALLNFRSVFGENQYQVMKYGFCKSNNAFKDLQGDPNKQLEFEKSYNQYKLWK